MSQDRLPPPEVEACLVRVRPSTQKGGTIIAEDVMDVAEHERRLMTPDGYRPAFCPTCGGRTLHAHDYRERVLRAEPAQPTTTVARHQCVSCEGIWQTLPGFIARHLWRTWKVVERVLRGVAPPGADGGPAPRWPRIPGRTARRWRARWLRPARLLQQVFATSGEASWVSLASSVDPAATCAQMVEAYGSREATKAGEVMAAVAALVYRLQPKVRLV